MDTHDEMFDKMYPDEEKQDTRWYKTLLLEKQKLNNAAKRLCAEIKKRVERGDEYRAKQLAAEWIELLLPNRRYSEAIDRRKYCLRGIEEMQKRISDLYEQIQLNIKFLSRLDEDIERLKKYTSEMLGIRNKDPLAVWAEVYLAEQQKKTGLKIVPVEELNLIETVEPEEIKEKDIPLSATRRLDKMDRFQTRNLNDDNIELC